MSLSWYLQRIRTFSAGEVLYRIRQRVQTHFLDRRLFASRASGGNFDEEKTIKVFLKSAIIEKIDSHFEYPIFEKTVDVFKPINWHLDVQSGKCFPSSFSHKINIRSDEYGSAKHVWEVNRMLFLTYICQCYSGSGDEKYLKLFMYHLTSWRLSNPYMVGVNWYSNIEVNIRLINWYYCWKLLDVPALQTENAEFASFVEKVWFPLVKEHAEYSFRHPSLYSSANNHLVSEYAGLFVAACCWDIPHRLSRLRYAQSGLEREILLQNSPEGVNREEAAEYIQFIDDFFLVAAVVARNFGVCFSKVYENRLHDMARYLNVMLDAKWNYPQYGDGDDGFLLRPDVGGHFNNFRSLLSAFAAFFEDSSLKRNDACWDTKCELMLGSAGRSIFEELSPMGDAPLGENHFYGESGHYFFRKRAGECETYLHFDAAPLGYLAIAAHGHADALSLILHVDGIPILVDSGTFTYHTHKEWRSYFVGTLAHNTVRIDFDNQAKQAGPTLWLNHFKTKLLAVSGDTVSAAHNGYARKGVSCVREIRYDRNSDQFVITDTLTATKKFTVEIPFHLNPQAEVKLGGSTAQIVVPGARLVTMLLDEKLNYELVRGREKNSKGTIDILGWFSNHFGIKEPTTVLYARKECSGSIQFITKVIIQHD